MSPVQQATSERTRRMVIFFGIVFGGLWLAMTIYFLMDSKKTTTASKSAVAIHATSPVAIGSTPAAAYKAPRVSATPLVHHSTSATPSWSFVPQSMQSTSSTIRIHQTSDATTQHVGGGSNGTGIATTNGHNSGRGIRSSTMAYTGAIYVPMTNNAITAVGATTAEELVEQKMGIAARRASMTEDNEYPEDRPDPVEDEVYTPVGDVAWVLMLLLTIGWCVGVRLRKKQECK